MRLLLSLSVTLLFAFGLLLVLDTTAAEALDRAQGVGLYDAFFRQLAYALGGALLGAICYAIGHQKLLQGAYVLFALSLLLLVLTLVPGIGQTINGSRRWLSLFGLSVQPSEIVKLVLPLTFIRWKMGQKGEITLPIFLQMGACLLFPIGLILVEPDNGTAAILLSVVVVLFFLSKIPAKFWAIPLGVFAILGLTAAYQLPYVHKRLEVYLHPELDLQGKGHQPYQAKIAAGSGQLWGRGLGESLQKLSYLPEARSDYIGAIFAEEFGFFGVLALLSVYGMFFYQAAKTALFAKKEETYLLAASYTYLIGFQVFLNLGVVSGLLPSKGTTLPFFSQGGSSLLVNFLLFFLILEMGKKTWQNASS